MRADSSLQREKLEDAFQVFNQVSGELVDSYCRLQKEVARLSSELSSARSDRLQGLAEKEKIANRLTRLLEALPAAVVVLDGAGQISQYNPAALELMPEIGQQTDWRLLYRDLFSADQQGDEQRLKSGRLVSIIRRSLDPDPGQILLLLDITERRQLQERMDRRRRLSQMGQMAAQLAHQIRTPLSSALLDVSHLTRIDLTSTQRERFSRRCLGRLRQMESQVNDMLAFARGEQFELSPISLRRLMDELLVHLEAPCQSSGATFTSSLAMDDDATILGNQAALLGAMGNIALNALQQGEHIHLRLEVRQSSDRLVIRFQDDGPGISEADQGLIFDPFYTTRANGTGLGLAVVQSVVLAHHGKLELQSRPGEGACFSIQLPLMKQPDSVVKASTSHADDGQGESVVRSFA